MDFIDDDKLDELRVHAITRLSSDNIPFFWRGNDDLRGFNFSLTQRNVARQFSHLDPKGLQTITQVAHNFCDESFHRRNIHDLKRRRVDAPVTTTVKTNFM